MAKLLDRLARSLGYGKLGRRDFNAAANNRLTGGWNSVNTSANADLFRGLDTLRARSRDLCTNNDYAKRFLSMVAANVVGGNGIMLQARIYDAPGKPDNWANGSVEAAWARWGARGSCDVTGRLSWRDLQLLVVRTVARDGEALVRVVRGKTAGNGAGFALQVLDIDRLDTKLMRAADAASGFNEIKMGVEVDGFGRAVAYWLRPYHPGELWLAQGQVLSQHQRVPANEIHHVHLQDRPEQVRAAPWMHAAMTQLNNLGGYEEAAVIAARVGASKMGFFTTPDGIPPGDGTDEAGVPYTDAEPGSFGTLGPGQSFESFNPDYPHAMYGDFVRACLRGVASGLDVSYHALANDLTQVNYSSIRSGTIEERDQWMSVQQWYIDAFIEPVFTSWIASALAFGQITLPNGAALPVEKLEKLSGHTWQPRRWQWVDPLKDMEANIVAIQNGLKAPQDIAAELGVDYEDVLVKIKQAQDLAEKIGVKLGKPEPSAPPPAAVDTSAQEDGAESKAITAIGGAVVTMAGAVVAMAARETPAPQLTFHNPVTIAEGAVRVDAPIAISTPAPEVHLEAQINVPERQVDIHVPPAQVEVVQTPAVATKEDVTYDGEGNIKSIVRRPLLN